MEMKLADNIRAFRKERALTQEQLAEVLGVTVGAVYKWEARLSVPELPLIVEMADFFDTSVDALLGYEMKDNRLGATEERLWLYHREKNRDGLNEVEKALRKYPGAFTIAYAGATLYHGIGLEAKDNRMLRRALELYEKARQLLPQNRDATINEQTLCSSIAGIHFALGEEERGIQLLKEQNAGNLYSALIGVVLAAEMNRPEEAAPYLSRGLMLAFNGIIYVAMGYANVYRARHDCENGRAILNWAIGALRGLKATDAPDFVDKICTVLYAHLSAFRRMAGEVDAARESLRQAVALARRFDAAPDYSCRNTRFIVEGEQAASAYDTLGATAMDALENALKDIGDAALWTMVQELTTNREQEG